MGLCMNPKYTGRLVIYYVLHSVGLYILHQERNLEVGKLLHTWGLFQKRAQRQVTFTLHLRRENQD